MVTSAVRNSLLENPLSKEKRDELMWSRNHNHKEKNRKGLVTSASLRIKRMPEDIPVQPELKEKEQSRLEEGMDHLKRKVNALGLHHKMHRRRKNSVDADDVELQTIREERVDTSDCQYRLDDISEVSPAVSSPLDSSKLSSRRKESSPSALNGSRLPLRRRSNSAEGGKNEVNCRIEANNESEHSTPILLDRPDELCGERRTSTSDYSGSYTVGGLRHMDSGSSTQRSFDF